MKYHILGEKKYKNLVNVLENYDFEIKDIIPVRSAYCVETNKGFKCLKQFKHHPKKAHKVYYITNHLISNGFNNVPGFITTKNNEICIKNKKNYFYMTDWIDGREADFSNIQELKSAIRLLAEFHNNCIHINMGNDAEIRDACNELLKTYQEKLESLKKYKILIETKNRNKEVDILYNNYLEKYIKQAEFAIEIIQKSNYEQISEEGRKIRQCCHDSFYYQNVMVTRDQKMYLIDLDSCLLDIRISDIGKFLRRIMGDSSYQWNFEIAKEILDTYQEKNMLYKDELKILIGIILFPHKYWKLGKKRYVNNKKWEEKRYINKIERLNNQNELLWNFYKEYVNYYEL